MVSNESYEQSRLADLSHQLEEIQHSSRAFHALLQDNMVSNNTMATCKAILLQTKELPPELVEAHYFPGRFMLSGFKGGVSRFKESNSNNVIWDFNAEYRINENDYLMTADETGTTLTTQSTDGTELSYAFNAELSSRFLAGIALGVLRSGEDFNPSSLAHIKDDHASKLVHYLYLIGNSFGKYVATQTSFIVDPESDRGLLVVKSERETEVLSSEDYNYRLVCKIGDTMLADTTTFQSEVARDNQSLLTRFAERQPGFTEPSDLLFGGLLQNDDELEGVLFVPEADPVEYMRVNATTMMFINSFLEKPEYKEMDLLPSIEEIVDDEEHLEGLKSSSEDD